MLSTKLKSSIYFNWHYFFGNDVVLHPDQFIESHKLFVMKTVAALAGGVAGTLTVASIHEALRRITPDAPRMDLLNVELIRKGLHTVNIEVPGESELKQWAVGGELFFDTTYYGLVAIGSKKSVWVRGILFGLVAGVTAVLLPKPLGLPTAPSNKTLTTQLMTVGLYLAGGLAAAAAAQMVENSQSQHDSFFHD